MNDKNLFQRINSVRRAVGYVQKDRSVSTGGSTYKAVSHDQVTAIIRGPMIEAGIICIPNLVESTFHPAASLPDGSQSKQRLYEATYDFAFVNEDKPEERVTIRIQSHAMDSGDKAPGKALSYAKKYAVLKLFELETGEDEESRVGESLDDALISNLLESIMKAETVDDLKAEFEKAYRTAEAAGDSAAQKIIIKAKNNRYRALVGKVSK